MNTHCRWVVSVLGLSLMSALGPPRAYADGPYRFLKEIAVGGDGGWDYLSVDAAARRLYVTHATKVVVIDLDKETVVGEIADTPGVHGFALAPELGRGFTSNGKENMASIVDLKTLQTIAKVETGENPDAILLVRQSVWVFNGHGRSVTIFDGKSGKVEMTAPLNGKPEFAVTDGANIYCNIEDKNEVALIGKFIIHWPLAPGEEPTGLAIDTEHHRLFAGCHNKLLVMLDSTTGKVVTTVPIGQGVDATAFDAGTQLAFASCGDGTVTIAHEDGPDKLTIVQTLATERGARTMALDPITHKIYLASAKFEPPPAPKPGEPRARPAIVAGSFKVLVYGMAK